MYTKRVHNIQDYTLTLIELQLNWLQVKGYYLVNVLFVPLVPLIEFGVLQLNGESQGKHL